MTPVQERWAEALAIERQHGDGAVAWVAARVAQLASVGDMAGVQRMREIAAKLDELADAGRA